MHYSFKYVSHNLEKMQAYVDYIFYEFWCKAPSQPYDLNLFENKKDLQDMIIKLYNSRPKAAEFFLDNLYEIYELFSKLDAASINQLKIWYKANNEIEKLCLNHTSTLPITYAEINNINKVLEVKLYSFYTQLYNNDFLSLSDIKSQVGDIKDHYLSFMSLNTKGICPFCGLHTIKGTHHSKREAYDHYLPKSKYPFNSINFKNLAPMCNECNSQYKLAKDPLHDKNNNRRKSFFLFSKVDPEINIEIDILKYDITAPALAKDVSIKISSTKHVEEVETWKYLFDIEERYKAECLGEYSKYWYTQIVDEFQTYKVSPNEALERVYKDRETLKEKQFLKKPFLKACEKENLF